MNGQSALQCTVVRVISEPPDLRGGLLFQTRKKKSSSKSTGFFVQFEIDFYFPVIGLELQSFPCLIIHFIYFGIIFVNTLTQ